MPKPTPSLNSMIINIMKRSLNKMLFNLQAGDIMQKITLSRAKNRKE